MGDSQRLEEGQWFEDEEHDDRWERPVRWGNALYVPDGCTKPKAIRRATKRPRSARFVGRTAWWWSPMHARVDHLYVSLDRTRKFVLLWMEWTDYPRMSVVRAFAPVRGQPSVSLIMDLVVAMYACEEEEYAEGKKVWNEAGGGLLSEEDFATVAGRIWPLEREKRAMASRAIAVTRPVPGDVIDELTMAEVYLRGEGQRAVAGGAVFIAGLFFEAAGAVEGCISVLTASRGEAWHGSLVAAHHGVRKSFDLLEKRLPVFRGRFDSVWKSMHRLYRTFELGPT